MRKGSAIASLVERERKREAGAPPELALSLDTAAVGLDDAPGDGSA
jgi:hypothetical protein